jgi:RimJ/RimL family protein N-acetyltransferase
VFAAASEAGSSLSGDILLQVPSTYFVAHERHGTEAFLLRSYHAGDGQHLSEAVNASYEHLEAFMAWAVPHQSVEQCERLCREFRGRWLLATDFALGIWQLDESRLLGGCGYHLREGPLHLGNAEIGMWIRAEAAGRGLGTAALRALLRWGFSEWPWVRLSWRCSAANEASQRVATKAGLQREGVLRSHAVDPDGSRRDTVCYVALRAEWIDAGNPSVGP